MEGAPARSLAGRHGFADLARAARQKIEARCRRQRCQAGQRIAAAGLVRRKGRNLYLMDRAKLEEFVNAPHFAETSHAA